MAGIAVPDNLRPTLAAIAKYHFWILAAATPLLLVPTLLAGVGGLKRQISDQQGKIKQKVTQADAIAKKTPHPNRAWKDAIDADAAKVIHDKDAEWRRFWHSQAGLRVWPAELGEPFLKDIATLQPGGKLGSTSLARYKIKAADLAASLPKRMGVEDFMRPRAAPAATEANEATAPRLTWDAGSQQRIYAAFVWEEAPSTTLVLMAQEELWVYGLFCDMLREFVANANGADDSPLPIVEDIKLGFEAGNVAAVGQARIRLPTATELGTGMQGMPFPGTPGGIPGDGAAASAAQPWNPRFQLSGGRGMPGLGTTPGVPAGPTEDDYRGWVYVDFKGRPLPVAELARPDMQMVHLMPFLLRVVIDQRQIDRLLTVMGSSTVPIDVREVRVNPGDAGARRPPGPAAGGPGGDEVPGSFRAYDVVLELRGSVALATRPADLQAAATADGAAP